MKKMVYSLYDEKAEAYANPFYMENDNCAIRAIVNSLRQNEDLAINAGDYKVYCLGSFNDGTGNLTGTVPVRLVTEVKALLNGGKEDETTREG